MMINRLAPALFFLAILTGLASRQVSAAEAKSVSQYGITWTFDKPYRVGQFVTGDWWVVGPVTVASVSPAPGQASADEPATSAKSIYGATSLSNDKRMRNGSMIVLGPNKDGGFDKQGYDSRPLNFDPSLTLEYPCHLPANQSLISTISSESFKDGKLATPYIPGALMKAQAKQIGGSVAPLALDTSAVLTCLDKEPPTDAFRPAYAGTDKTIYEAKDIRWDLLPNLKPVASTPDWEKMARIYQRPWLDHINNWVIQYSAPGQNQPAYGGDVTNMTAYASLMLLLDAPREQKQKLMIGFLQYGIDLHGLALCGRQWFSDGGHWMGRKWPILFTSLMLDKPEWRAFPPVSSSRSALYGNVELDSGSEGPEPTTFFSEDLDTYYGKGADGQDVLWQVAFHTHARQPYQEKPYDGWTDDEKFQNNYTWIIGNWNSFALAALYMKAKKTWNHDAFFDYADWFMQPGQQRYESKEGHKIPTRTNTDKFVQEMWDTYRSRAPSQPGGKDNLKWVWTSDKKGHLVQNSKH